MTVSPQPDDTTTPRTTVLIALEGGPASLPPELRVNRSRRTRRR